MNAEESMRICRLAKAASPAQAVDEYTPELWFMVLKGYRYADAEEALTQLAGEQEWIHVSHIKRRVKKIRVERLTAFGVLPDPPRSLDPSQTVAYHAWMAETTRMIADGDLTELPELPPSAAAPAPGWVKELREKAAAGVRDGLEVAP